MIQFTCPTCGKEMAVRDELAGRAGKCACGAAMRVPSPMPQTSVVFPQVRAIRFVVVGYDAKSLLDRTIFIYAESSESAIRLAGLAGIEAKKCKMPVLFPYDICAELSVYLGLMSFFASGLGYPGAICGCVGLVRSRRRWMALTGALLSILCVVGGIIANW
jgi:hypothetical protein